MIARHKSVWLSPRPSTKHKYDQRQLSGSSTFSIHPIHTWDHGNRHHSLSLLLFLRSHDVPTDGALFSVEVTANEAPELVSVTSGSANCAMLQGTQLGSELFQGTYASSRSRLLILCTVTVQCKCPFLSSGSKTRCNS